MEMEELRGQLQEMEMKSARLEKELSLFKAKEQKSGEHLSKDTSEMKENQAHSTAGQQKSLKNQRKLLRKKKCSPARAQEVRMLPPHRNRVKQKTRRNEITHRLLRLNQHKLRNTLGLKWNTRTVK